MKELLDAVKLAKVFVACAETYEFSQDQPFMISLIRDLRYSLLNLDAGSQEEKKESKVKKAELVEEKSDVLEGKEGEKVWVSWKGQYKPGTINRQISRGKNKGSFEIDLHDAGRQKKTILPLTKLSKRHS